MTEPLCFYCDERATVKLRAAHQAEFVPMCGKHAQDVRNEFAALLVDVMTVSIAELPPSERELREAAQAETDNWRAMYDQAAQTNASLIASLDEARNVSCPECGHEFDALPNHRFESRKVESLASVDRKPDTDRPDPEVVAGNAPAER